VRGTIMARSGTQKDFHVVDEPRAAEPCGGGDDKVAVPFRGLPQVGLPAHGGAIRLPAAGDN